MALNLCPRRLLQGGIVKLVRHFRVGQNDGKISCYNIDETDCEVVRQSQA